MIKDKDCKNAESLRKAGFNGISICHTYTMKCCRKWYSSKVAHGIFKDDLIFWRNEKGRHMGYCQACAYKIAEEYEHQLAMPDFTVPAGA